jgi:Asp-tRNA(Asn)/Glu-tRNA(Gln) amidotransferase A subunit family amidase
VGYASTGDPAPNAPWTALGVPVIAVPILGAEPPLAVQIAAAWGCDDALVSFAATLEFSAEAEPRDLPPAPR